MLAGVCLSPPTKKASPKGFMLRWGSVIVLVLHTPCWNSSFNGSYRIQPQRYNEVLFFKVTKVVCDPIPKASYQFQDLYEGSTSTLGELGCWVDPNITRILQIGIEHSRVPIVGSYIQLGIILFAYRICQKQTFGFQISPALYSSTRNLPHPISWVQKAPFLNCFLWRRQHYPRRQWITNWVSLSFFMVSEVWANLRSLLGLRKTWVCI